MSKELNHVKYCVTLYENLKFGNPNLQMIHNFSDGYELQLVQFKNKFTFSTVCYSEADWAVQTGFASGHEKRAVHRV